MKKRLINIIAFCFLVILYLNLNNIYNYAKNYMIEYEAKNLKEFPYIFKSAGNCRVQATNKALELNNSKIIFYKTNKGSFHTIALDDKDLVYDLSDSAKKYNETGFNGIPRKEYEKLSPIKEIIYQVNLKNKKIVSEYLNPKYNSKAIEYKNYVIVFIKERLYQDNKTLEDE